ncbi:MAG: hypothetical protein PF517_08645 [Salinivirgaceae bacterium]|nr:hypothetical protein [Salinivirgaceae bacterium]
MDNQILQEGITYLSKLDKINPETSKLGSEVIYNFVSLGIEAVLTAVLMDYNKMVDHSGISKMLRELQTVEDVDKGWIETARFMNRFQSYCSLEPIPVKIPTHEDLTKIIDFGKNVEIYAKGKIKI